MESYPPNEINPLLIGIPLVNTSKNNQIRKLGKIFASSLLRFQFNGDIVVLRNFEEPLFAIPRVNLTEVERTINSSFDDDFDILKTTLENRLLFAEYLIPHAANRDWVILSDMDIVGLRNWDHLFEETTADILVDYCLHGRPDPGFFAIRGKRYKDFHEQWRSFTFDLGCAGQERPDLLSLEKVLNSGGFKVGRFERGEIARPFEKGADITHAMDAAVVHLCGAPMMDKVRLATALHFMRVYGDDNGVFLDILES